MNLSGAVVTCCGQLWYVGFSNEVGPIVFAVHRSQRGEALSNFLNFRTLAL
jgi:hypothetical protein